MVEQGKTWITDLFKQIAPTMVVAAISGGLVIGLNTWYLAGQNTIRIASIEKEFETTLILVGKNNVDIAVLNNWRESDFFKGDRYTLLMAQTDKEAAEKATVIRERELAAMVENQIRVWSALRKHIQKGQHQGADYRLKALEESK